jgi:geranylgeranyl diphosphate synthase type II
MIAGQSIDIAATHEAQSASQSSDCQSRDVDASIRNLKTSSMMRMALCVGAILSGASENQLALQSRFALLLGEAFQISDDLLDLKEDAALSVATARSESIALERGAEHAKRRALSLVVEAKETLTSECGQAEPAQLLCELADYVAQRKT